MNDVKKLYRVYEGQMIMGVCTGLAKYFDVDVILVRAVFIALIFAGGSGLLMYILLAIIIPAEPGHEHPHAHPHQAVKEDIKDFAERVEEGIHKAADEVKKHHHPNNGKNFLGFIILGVGALWLFNVLTGFHIFRSELFWPIVIMFVGVFILVRRS